jgi:hypothetical protein
MRRFWEDPMLSISRQKAEDHDAKLLRWKQRDSSTSYHISFISSIYMLNVLDASQLVLSCVCPNKMSWRFLGWHVLMLYTLRFWEHV